MTVVPAVPQAPPARAAIDQLLDAMRGYLHLETTDHVLFALAVAVGSRVETGEPLWGLVVGPASSGKTEAVRMLDEVAQEHPDELTAPSLLSWSKGKEPRQVGILARVGDPGFLTVADFSTVLATSDKGGRDQLFALLRRAYDGHVSRDLGNSPRALTWAGRLTLLAACTPVIDSYSSHSDALGPRWLFCRLKEQETATKRATGRKALRAGELGEHRSHVRALAAGIVEAASARIADVELSHGGGEAIVDAAIVSCYGRAGVERNGYGRREISGMAVVEEPPRLTSQLALLGRSLLALGLSECEALDLCRRCALDSVPKARLGALQVLVERSQATIGEVARLVGCHRHVARFALEELQAIGVADCFIDEDDDSDDGAFTPKPWVLSGPDVALVRRVLTGAEEHVARGTKSGSPTHEHTRIRESEGML